MPGLSQSTWVNLINLLEEGKTTEIKSLISSNPEVLDSLGTYAFSPLHLAARYGNSEVVKLLLTIKPELIEAVSLTPGSTAFEEATEHGHIDIMKLFLHAKPELINIVNKNKETVLHTAAKYGKNEVVQFLLNETTIIVDSIDDDNQTALYKAVGSGNDEIVELLLNAHPTLADKRVASSGDTALHLALNWNYHNKIVESILKAAPEVIHAKNYRQETALASAANSGNHNVIKWFFERAVSIHTKCTDITKLIYSYLANENDVIIDNQQGRISMIDPQTVVNTEEVVEITNEIQVADNQLEDSLVIMHLAGEVVTG